MLRLKANVGIKCVYWKDRCPNFSSYICGSRSSEDQKKTLDGTRRKLRTDLPTSQSQVIAFVGDNICILDFLSKMSSSSLQALSSFTIHRISMPACVGEAVDISKSSGRQSVTCAGNCFRPQSSELCLTPAPSYRARQPIKLKTN